MNLGYLCFDFVGRVCFRRGFGVELNSESLFWGGLGFVGRRMDFLLGIFFCFGVFIWMESLYFCISFIYFRKVRRIFCDCFIIFCFVVFYCYVLFFRVRESVV